MENSKNGIEKDFFLERLQEIKDFYPVYLDVLIDQNYEGDLREIMKEKEKMTFEKYWNKILAYIESEDVFDVFLENEDYRKILVEELENYPEKQIDVLKSVFPSKEYLNDVVNFEKIDGCLSLLYRKTQISLNSLVFAQQRENSRENLIKIMNSIKNKTEEDIQKVIQEELDRRKDVYGF